jgi:hypothetical protein
LKTGSFGRNGRRRRGKDSLEEGLSIKKKGAGGDLQEELRKQSFSSWSPC